MKVEFIKDHTDEHGRNWKKGKRTSLSSDFAKKLLKDKIIKPTKDFKPTKELVDKLEKIGVEIK